MSAGRQRIDKPLNGLEEVEVNISATMWSDLGQRQLDPAESAGGLPVQSLSHFEQGELQTMFTGIPDV